MKLLAGAATGLFLARWLCARWLNVPDPGTAEAVERAKRWTADPFEEMAREGRWPR